MWGRESEITALRGLPEPGSRWELIEKIGSGTFGDVHKARDFTSSRIVAIKIMVCESDKDEELAMELNILQNHCSHPNLPEFYGAFVQHSDVRSDMNRLWLAMEMCQSGSMSDIAKGLEAKEQHFSESVIAYVMKETLKALVYLHSNDIIHRDVKGGNILVTQDAQVKLVDFGVCAKLKERDQKRNTSIGTPYWMAPEVIACEHYLEADYDSRCDVWSFGITIIELCDAHPPLHDIPINQAIMKIPRNPPPTVKSPTSWSSSLIGVVEKCLVKNYENRPSVIELGNTDFLQSVPDNVKPVRRHLMAAVDLSKGNAASSIISDNDSTDGEDEIDGDMTLRSGRKLGNQVVHDLAKLEHLDEPTLLFHLKNRYGKDLIYTNIGDILLAINPFQTLNIYDEKTSNLYCSCSEITTLPPHVYSIAWHCYKDMIVHRRNQCCVISGESGSGKTETAKFLVRQFTRHGKAVNAGLESSILKVNPLFEAFGNASTVMNSNSSRFGKYLNLSFLPTGHIVSAQLSQYLLESSRVVFQAPGEHNFHIFYYLYAGLSERSLLHRYQLVNINLHRYIRTSQSEVRQSADSSRAAFKEILQCFDTIGFSETEVDNVIHVLVSILHIGDIQIQADNLSSSTHGVEATAVGNPDKIPVIGFLLGLKAEDIVQAITTNVVTLKGETIVCPNTVEQAGDCRDAMAKALYGRLFSWLVNRCNRKLQGKRDIDLEQLEIGILDIFGFEDFKTNGFEQLFINITNEQIQYFFNQHIFALEQEEYGREGIPLSAVLYTDNSPCLDMMLQKPLGLLPLLDEESRFPKATDRTLIEKLHSHLSDSDHYKAPRDNSRCFTVVHYAGKVTYQVTSFLEKNRNTLPVKMTELLFHAGNALVQQLFDCKLTKTGNLPIRVSSTKVTSQRLSVAHSSTPRKPNTRSSAVSLSAQSRPSGRASGGMTTSRRMQTAAWHFSNSLNELLIRMRNAQPRFIRCIKPNNMQKKCDFVMDKVEHQLKYTGVMESIRIRQQGFSNRILFSDFLKRYKIIGFALTQDVAASGKACGQIAQKAGLADFALGKTKVFLRYYHVDMLIKQRAMFDQHARVIQKFIRGWVARRSYLQRQKQRATAATKIQSAFRGFLLRRFYRRRRQKLVKAVVGIQAYIRGHVMRSRLREMKVQHRAAKIAQQAIRAWLTRRRYVQLITKRRCSALVIQCAVRRWLAVRERKRRVCEKRRKHIQQLNNAATAIQSCVRMFIAKRLLVRMKKQHDLHMEALRQLRLRQNEAATTIEKTVRGWIVRQKYKSTVTLRNTAARKIQLAYRQKKHKEMCSRILKAKVEARRTERANLEMKRNAVLASLLTRPTGSKRLQWQPPDADDTQQDMPTRATHPDALTTVQPSSGEEDQADDHVDGNAAPSVSESNDDMSELIAMVTSSKLQPRPGSRSPSKVVIRPSAKSKRKEITRDSYSPITPEDGKVIPAPAGRRSFKQKSPRASTYNPSFISPGRQASLPRKPTESPRSKSPARAIAAQPKSASDSSSRQAMPQEQFFDPPLPQDDDGPVDIVDKDVYKPAGLSNPVSQLAEAIQTFNHKPAPTPKSPVGSQAQSPVGSEVRNTLPSMAVSGGRLVFQTKESRPTTRKPPRPSVVTASQNAKVSQLAAKFNRILTDPATTASVGPKKVTVPGRLSNLSAFQVDTSPSEPSFLPAATRIRKQSRQQQKQTGFFEFTLIE